MFVNIAIIAAPRSLSALERVSILFVQNSAAAECIIYI